MYLKKAFTAVIVLTAFVLAQTARAENLPDFSELAAASGPAVVNINTERTANVSGPEDMFGDMFRNMPPGFDRFFGGPFNNRGQKAPKRKQKSLGSGFLISADG